MLNFKDYYALGYERARLDTGCGKLEFERTKELIRRFLSPRPAVILDIGGGTGPYSFWLAGLGYEVHLLDIVPRHVELARKAQDQAGRSKDHEKMQDDIHGQDRVVDRRSPLAEAVVGDARSLPWESDRADITLLLGPLYHLTGRDDRLLALREARRVLKPRGCLVAVGISRFASVLGGLWSGDLADPAFAAIADRDLKNGWHRNPTNKPEYFTDAFFHHPDELRTEIASAGFEVVGVFGVEGPGWLVQNFDWWWEEKERRERLLGIARRLEQEPSLLGMSAHLLAVARKSGSNKR